ncbi:MAG: fumarylacetoacetate hydrolase family protein [Rickettsiales bacterium]|nr:fumarylacetoacetate hydrolase family protein [Rickettsiales bacterium]
MKLFNLKTSENTSIYAVANENGYAEYSKVISNLDAPLKNFSDFLGYVSENFSEVENNLKKLDKKDLTPLDKASFALPLSQNSKVICVGLNYLEHAKEGFQEVPKHPVFFIRLNSSFVADGENLILPKVSDKYDYEAELAIVIGKQGRHINEANAEDYILGYTLANDGSVRDFQKRTPQWTLGKNFDKSGSLGGYIITKDELPAKAKGLKVRSYLNGNLMQDGNTTDMIYDLGFLIAELSKVMTLNVGDVILTGTPAGVGFARDPKVFMKNNDEIIIEIESIGRLKNIVKSEA